MKTYLPLIVAVSLGGGAARADMFTPSKADQVKLGKRVAEDIRQKNRVLPSSDVRVRLLRRVGSRILSTFPEDAKQPWEFSFDVVESSDINAFALPGGPVFFTTAILDKMDTEDEVAAVLGHELTHVRKEHWAKSYADQQKRALGLTLLLSIFRANRTVADLASITNDVVLTLPYSRKMETEADSGGFDSMVKAGYNPQGMVDVFAMLSRTSKGGRPPEWLSTHPNDKKRIERIDAKIEASGAMSYLPQRPLPF